MGKKRGYFVKVKDEESGIAVVAINGKEAKKIAYHSGNLTDSIINTDWIDIRVTWMRKANVEDLPNGVITDEMLALRRGVYTWVECGECDKCHEGGQLEMYNNKALCLDCLDGEK